MRLPKVILSFFIFLTIFSGASKVFAYTGTQFSATFTGNTTNGNFSSPEITSGGDLTFCLQDDPFDTSWGLYGTDAVGPVTCSNDLSTWHINPSNIYGQHVNHIGGGSGVFNFLIACIGTGGGCNNINKDPSFYISISIDGSYNVTVNSPPINSSSEKSIMSFSFQDLPAAVNGAIDEVNHTITLNVPFGTDVSAIAPTITVSSGASVVPNGNIQQDFSSPVTYTVTAADGSTQAYTVTVAIAACTTDCYSNVLFLPGMMASQLYEAGLDCGPDLTGSECGDKNLWVSLDDSLQEKLSLDTQGKSINKVYTKNDTQKLDGDNGETGVLDEIAGLNIYKSFFSDLKEWKQNGIIADYDFIPYDWRLSLDDIITDGASNKGNLSYTTSQDFSESFILKKLEELQKTSKSGKVTIIAHSNGGLVAKALVQKLKDTNNPLYNKIDKIILVGVPQVGTPDAAVALLHGTELGNGFIMGKARSRQFSENMPTIYNILPSAGYFTTVDPSFAVDKLISFEHTPFFDAQVSQYGPFVSDETELKNYILGSDGRNKPSFNDTIHANIGNSALYSQAEAVHQILDTWTPSPSTKVIQVAGWGEETLAGLDYKSYVSDILGDQELSYKPRVVVDGDGTVVVPSALWMPTSPNVERWWVNLKEENGPLSIIKNVHRNILEIINLRNFIKSKIIDSAFTDSDNIVVDNTSTLNSVAPRLHFTLHSPLTLGIVDSQDRYTGMDPVTKEIKEEIPGVEYRQIGDVQFISVPAGTAYTLKMQGYQTGNFSLDVDKQAGDTVTASTSFQGIPTGTSTLASMDITPNTQLATSVLKLDQNGDGAVDKTLQATPDGVTIYDTTPPELQVTFDINTKDVVFSAQDNLDKHPSIVTTSTSITLKDNAGNTTIIPLTKLKELPTRLRLSYNKITRNGVTVTVPNTNIVYNWQEKKDALTDLDTNVTVKGVEKYVFNYKKANNATIIKEKTSAGIFTTTKPGFVVVTAKTEGDGLKVSY